MRVTLDFETACETDLPEAGAERYTECPTFEVLCLVYRHGKACETWAPGRDAPALRRLAADPDVIFEAHNTGFEKAVWRNYMVPVWGFPPIPPHRWRDTMAVCAYKSIPQKLEHTLLALRLPGRKDKEGSSITNRLSKANKRGEYDRSPETLQRVMDYCKSDVEIEVELSHRIGDLPPDELRNWLDNEMVNRRGLKLDMKLVDAMLDIVEQATTPLIAEHRELTGLNPTQGEKVKAWLKERGCDLPDLSKETVAKVLGIQEESDDADDVGEPSPRLLMPVGACRRALEIRALINSSSIKKLKRMKESVCGDGRARGLLNYHGTGPGRVAGRLWQPLNMPRPTVEHLDMDAAVAALMTRDITEVAKLGPAMDVVVSSLRYVITAEPGSVLVAGDYSGIQARVVLALAGQFDKVDLMASGKDVYCDMAEAIYKRPINKKDDPEARQIGKNSVLGLGFGMGMKKFKLKYAQNQPDEFVQNVVDAYRKSWAPGVPKLWHALNDAVVRCVWEKRKQEAYGIEYRLEDGWLSCRLPSGRKIWYWNPQQTREAMPWDENDIRPGVSYSAWKMNGLRTVKLFGGLLTENVVMGIERDIMTHGRRNLEKAGFPIVLEVYDEAVAEVEEWAVDEVAFKQCMEDVPAWCKALRIPVAVELWEKPSRRYHK